MASTKGGAFERLAAKQLGMWWTNNERDDIFWRSSTSGGRATQRAKSGKSTANSNGDIALLDVIGKPLLDACSLELKNGYGKWSIMDLIDRKKMHIEQTFEKFINQAIREKEAARAPYFLLITKKDGRDPLITMPIELYNCIWDFYGPYEDDALALIRGDIIYYTISFDKFLNWCPPAFFIEYKYKESVHYISDPKVKV